MTDQSAVNRLIVTRNYIGGKWIEPDQEATLEVFDKFSGTKLGSLPLAGEEQIQLSIRSAHRAQALVRAMSAEQRQQCLSALAEGIKSAEHDFADLIIREAGKPRSYAQAEVKRAIQTVEIAAAEAIGFVGEVVPIDYGSGIGKTAYTKRFPLGTVLCITPFNFPLNLVLHKICPALAAGCSVIVKPAPQAPFSAFALVELCRAAGFPEQAMQVLLCENTKAESMVTDERVDMISFTGSDQVGWHLKDKAGKKKVALELGGNAGVLVSETNDLSACAAHLAKSAMLYSGQICISTQRIYVIDELYEQFVNEFVEQVRNIKSGNPHDGTVTNGPLIGKSALERIDSWVKSALENGATLHCGGKIQNEAHHIYSPTVLSSVKRDDSISCSEVFGPVVVVESVKSFEEGIDRINDSKYGLQAGVFTNQIQQITYAHDHLEVGGVIINHAPGFRVDGMPYGGVKDSGFGREGIRYAMEEMTEARLLVY